MKVGDYIDYDAGEWTAEDLEKIKLSAGNPTLHSTVNDAINDNQALPTEQGQFGGFELGQSRNSNSTENNSSYKPRTSGWRVWDIDDNGNVTIIHAGHSETYFHTYGNYAASINILRNRDCSMYENDYAVDGSAHILKGNEAADWYMKNCLTEEEKERGLRYELESYGEDVDGDGITEEKNFYCGEGLGQFVTAEEMPVIEVLENGSYYFFASAFVFYLLMLDGADDLYYVHPINRHVNYGSSGGYGGFGACGVRMLVSLKSEIQLEQAAGAGSVENPWKIGKN